MLFRKSKKTGVPPACDTGAREQPQLFRIEFEMMLKGSTYKRRKGVIRQFGVTVNGSTRLVTSGDVVDRETYRALIAAGAIRPIYPEPPDEKRKSSVDFTTIEQIED